MKTVRDLECVWCKTKGHEMPHFWRYQSQLHMHCQQCCGKALNFSLKRSADYSSDSHYFYQGDPDGPVPLMPEYKQKKRNKLGTVRCNISL